MKLRMDKTLLLWVDVAYGSVKWNYPDLSKPQLFGAILRVFERSGDAMRYLNPEGRIAWKPSPSMLEALADAERDAEQDLEDGP